MILTTQAVNTRLEDLPTTVAAYTLMDENAEYTIVINSRLSVDRQRQAYEHELRHIQNDDFDKQDVEKIELEAHGITVPEQRPEWVEQRLKKLRKQREKIKQELAEYEETMEPIRILWNEEKILESQRLGKD